MSASDTGTFIGILLIVLYMLPGVIAICRKHSNWLVIGLLNFFLGWTVVVWFVCLIWSFIGSNQTIIINNHTPNNDKT